MIEHKRLPRKEKKKYTKEVATWNAEFIQFLKEQSTDDQEMILALLTEDYE